MKPLGPCRHCGNVRRQHGRGLCFKCHGDLDIRRAYDCEYAMLDDPEGPMPSPAEPTAAAPGTEQKLRVLAERMERMEDLWHPADAGFADGCGRSLDIKPRRRSLDEADVLLIRRLSSQGRSDRAIARMLGIRVSTVYDVTSGRTWQNVKGATG